MTGDVGLPSSSPATPGGGPRPAPPLDEIRISVGELLALASGKDVCRICGAVVLRDEDLRLCAVCQRREAAAQSGDPDFADVHESPPDAGGESPSLSPPGVSSSDG